MGGRGPAKFNEAFTMRVISPFITWYWSSRHPLRVCVENRPIAPKSMKQSLLFGRTTILAGGARPPSAGKRAREKGGRQQDKPRRIATQLKPDGEQPAETNRVESFK